MKTIYGKKIRTNNETLEGVMELWQEIAGLKLSGDLYAIYTNYASDHTGDYDLLIGTETADLPDQVILADTTYMEIPVEHNSIDQVGTAWKKIWENTEIEAQRTYLTDYEKYSQDGRITIYLSIK